MSSVEEIKTLHEKCVGALLSCVTNVHQHLKGPEAKKQVSDLRKIAVEFVDIDSRNKIYDMALEEVKKKSGEIGEYDLDKDVTVMNNILDNLSKRQNQAKNHPTLVEFDRLCKQETQRVNDVLNDSDIIETASTNDFIDPITKKTIQRPVKNLKCGHLYDEASIHQLIKVNSRTRCPVVGCGNRNFITTGDLVFDRITMNVLSQSQANKNT